MTWPVRHPEDDKVAVTQSVAELYDARREKRTALQRLLRALDEVKIDDGLVKIGNDLIKPEKGVP